MTFARVARGSERIRDIIVYCFSVYGILLQEVVGMIRVKLALINIQCHSKQIYRVTKYIKDISLDRTSGINFKLHRDLTLIIHV